MNTIGQQLESFITELICHQNRQASRENINIWDRRQYQELFFPVKKILLENPQDNINRVRKRLFKFSGLQRSIKDIVGRGMVPGIVMTYGTKMYQETIACGNQQEFVLTPNGELARAEEAISYDTIFDLASVTKIFTGTMVLKLVEEGLVDLDLPVIKYDGRFCHIKNITIRSLLSFSANLITDQRLEGLKSVEEAEKMIFNIRVVPQMNRERYYSDMGAIVLKYIIEKVTGENFFKILTDTILYPCKMNDSYVDIPEGALTRTASNNFERKIIHDQYMLTTNVYKGIVHDPKAQVLNLAKRQLHGHAGLFSTVPDMAKFAQALMNYQVLRPASVNEMGVNRTGEKFENGGYSQYLGYLCYSKHPVAEHSEVFHPLSGNAIGSGGYTGNQLTIDAQNGIFLFMAGNRCHNRITSIIPPSGKSKECCFFPTNKEMVKWNDGKEYISSSQFAWDRDLIVHRALKLSLQYKFLEVIYPDLLQENETRTITCI